MSMRRTCLVILAVVAVACSSNAPSAGGSPTSVSQATAAVKAAIEAANYVDVPAVRDRGLITASGLGDVEFARELLEELNVLSAEDRAAWATIFRGARLPGTG